MKLGTQTGSLTNHILSRAVIGQPEPTVGMGATILCWTDRHAATITDVMQHRGETIITVRRDIAKRVDTNGVSECQSYEFTYNPNSTAIQFRRTKDGSWQEVIHNADTGRFRKVDGSGLRIGEREEYRDFGF